MSQNKLTRKAQFLSVEISRGYGVPPYHNSWEPLYDAKVESIIENANAVPSECTFYMPAKRWDDDAGIYFGDKIKITGKSDAGSEKIMYVGFVTKRLRQFSGGTEKGGKYEHLGFYCLDARWLMAALCPIYGQISTSPDDEDEAGFPMDNTHTFFGGRRCIFNPDGIPNRYKDGITYDEQLQQIFTNPDIAEKYTYFWNWEDIARYILSPSITAKASEYFPVDLDAVFVHTPEFTEDWIKIPKNIMLEGLNPMTALQYICKRLGWAFRLSYDSGTEYPQIVLLKSGQSTKHKLYSPAVYEPGDNMDTVKNAVAAGRVLVSSAQFDEDISNIVNSPLCLAAPLKVEFTAELVPAWLDEDFVPDTADDNSHLFISEAELQATENPSQYTFYKFYHRASVLCKRDVGRTWSLNETFRYTPSPYNRVGFDLSKILPNKYAQDTDGKTAYGYFDHQLLPAMSQVMQGSAGILVEFSFDGGENWHIIPAAFIPLEKEAGIQIVEPNLSEIKPADAVIEDEEGALDGLELNYFTSLAKDKLSGAEAKDWQTRVRVTASIQLERRLETQLAPPAGSGSPFFQADVIDLSNKFFQQARHTSSRFSAAEMPVNEVDDYREFSEYIEKLRKTLQDTAISGRIILERLWINKFNVGESIEAIEGRDYYFRTSMGDQELYPEIVQIIYLVQKQKMQLITRDLRFSEHRP